MYLLGSIYPLQRVPPLPLRWSTNKLDVGFSPYIKRGCSPRSAVRAIRESNTERNIMLICGIDIGKNHHEACLIDETGRQLAKTLRLFAVCQGRRGCLLCTFQGPLSISNLLLTFDSWSFLCGLISKGRGSPLRLPHRYFPAGTIPHIRWAYGLQ